MPPRALLDANVFISYLLSTNRRASATAALFQSANQNRLILLFPPAVEGEIRATVASRPHLAVRLDENDIDQLIDTIEILAAPATPLLGPYPPIGRDPKDDYLIAHAVVAEADYLVSWDQDLLDLREIGGVKIVSPPELLAHLRDEPLRS